MADLALNIDNLLPYLVAEEGASSEMLEKAMAHGEEEEEEEEEEETSTTYSGETLLPMKSEPSPKKAFPPDPEKYQSCREGLAFLVLRDYLQPGSIMHIDDVVDGIVEVWPDDYLDMRDLNELWFELGQQIPYYHPSQIKLARVVAGVGTSYKRIHKHIAKDPHTAQRQYYDHLSIDLRDNYSGPDREDMSPAQWVNYQAFQANLRSPLSCLNFGIWNMRETFEEDHEKEDIVLQEARILGTAQWILWCGQDLFKRLLVPDAWWGMPQPNESPRDKKDRLRLENANGLTSKRWQLAKAGFEKAASSQNFSHECRGVAQRAAETMNVLEKVMSSSVA